MNKAAFFTGILSIMMLMVCSIGHTASPVTVDDNFDATTAGWGTTAFDNIQDAINAVDANGIVNVAGGVYYESLTINKPLSLLGQAGAILYGDGLGNVDAITILSSDVTVDNMVIGNFQGNGIIVGNTPGIYQNVHITNNVSISNIRPGSHGMGIYVGMAAENLANGTLADFIDCTGLIIEGNAIYNTANAGIALQSIQSTSAPLLVKDNEIYDCDTSAIWIDAVVNAKLENNNIHESRFGVFISSYADGWFVEDGQWGSRDIDIIGNIIYDNSDFGVVLYTGHPSTININQNSITGNTTQVRNFLNGALNANNNWWGPLGPVNVDGNVSTDPYYIDDNLTTLTNDPITDIYVDDDYSSGNSDGYVFGVQAFNTIQNGIDAVSEAGNVHIASGTYTENLIVDVPSVSLIGTNQGIAAYDVNRSTEEVVVEGRVDIEKAQVTIDGLKVLHGASHPSRVFAGIFINAASAAIKNTVIEGDSTTAGRVGITNTLNVGLHHIENNNIHSWESGVTMNAATQTVVLYNGFFNNEYGFYSDAQQDLTISYNDFTNNSNGDTYFSNAGTGIVARYNSFLSANAMAWNLGEIIDAQMNWWGHGTGPDHSTNNGSGNQVTGDVNFANWAEDTSFTRFYAPVANDDTFFVNENSQVVFTVSASDADLDPLTYTLQDDVNNGTLVFDTVGNATYTPDQDYIGADSFTFFVNDGTLDSNLATIDINVTDVNVAPVASDDSVATQEDTAVIIDVLANDSDGDSDPLTVTIQNQASNGSVVVNGDKTVTYTPNSNIFGNDSFTYQIADGRGGFDSASVAITVTEVNDAPLALDDTASTLENQSVVIAVLSNDSDIDGDTLSAAIATAPQHGSVVLNGDNSITYTPNNSFFGPDSFTYTALDNRGGVQNAMVFISVANVNNAPIATNDSATTLENTPVTIDVLANDSDSDGDPLSISQGTNPSHGSLTYNANNTITYKPALNYSGQDSFTYTLFDNNGKTATATVAITVNIDPDSPRAIADNLTIKEDVEKMFSTSDLLANDYDPQGTKVTFLGLQSNPIKGQILDFGNGQYQYRPHENIFGNDSFTYQITDGDIIATGKVFVTIEAVNDKPTAVPDNATTEKGESVMIFVLSNDSDIEDSALTAAVDTQPQHGQATVNADNSITYTPDDGYAGSDEFIYKVIDSEGGYNRALVRITIEGIADPTETPEPTATPTLTPTPTPTLTPTPEPTVVETPTPVETPEPTPVISPFIFDDINGSVDLSGEQDFDTDDNRALLVGWDYEALGLDPANVDFATVMISVNNDDYVQFASTTASYIEWVPNAQDVEIAFFMGPQFGFDYQFQIIVSLRDGSVTEPFTTNGAVSYLPVLYVTDSIGTTDDLSYGQDFDEADDQALAIRWNLSEAGFTAETIANLQLNISVNEAAYVEFANVANVNDTVLEWVAGAEGLVDEFSAGPQFNNTYQFQIVVTGTDNSVATFTSAGPVEYLEGSYPNPSPTPIVEPTVNPEFELSSQLAVTDDANSTVDLVSYWDYDQADDCALTIHWSYAQANIPADDVREVHVYVSVNNNQNYVYLGKTFDGTTTSLDWYENAPGIEQQIFRCGPTFGHSYRFRFYAISNSGTPFAYGPFTAEDDVDYLEGEDVAIDPNFDPTPVVTPVPTWSDTMAVIIADDIHAENDLSGDTDYDMTQDKSLVVTWNYEIMGIDPSNVKDVHVYISADGSSYNYLGRTKDQAITMLEWRENAYWVENALFRSGPQFGHSYQFQLYVMTKEGQPFYYGPYINENAVEYKSTVTITDHILSTEDLSNGQDSDSENNQDLVVRWNLEGQEIEEENIREIHIYVKVDDGEFTYLGLTKTVDSTFFEWRANAVGIENALFVDGPQFGHNYTFQIYVMMKEGCPPFYGPMNSSGAVQFIQE